MSRPFDSSLWARQGVIFEPALPRHPFAERANRLQYMPWLERPSWLARLRRAARPVLRLV